MKEIDVFLNDKFFELSAELEKIHKTKKEKKLELKQIYDDYKEIFEQLDEDARKLVKEWEESQNKGD